MEFKKLENIWNNVLSNSKSDNVNLRFDWLYNWWSYMAKNQELFIVLIKDKNDIIVGIAPLMIQIYKYKRVMLCKRLLFIGNGDSDFHDFIITEPRSDILTFLIQYLLSLKVTDYNFSNIPYTSPNFEFIKELAIKKPNLSIKEQSKCYFIQTNGKYEDYRKNTASYKFVHRDLNRLYNHYKGLKWEVKKINKFSDNDFIIIRNLHKQSQQRKERGSKYEEKEFEGFLKQTIKEYMEEELAKIYYLMINDEVAAFMLLFDYKGTYYWWNTGYNEYYSKLSPSKVLLNEIIKMSFEDKRINEFNFMRGDTEYKSKWAKDYTYNQQIRFYNKSIIFDIIRMLKKYLNRNND